MAVGASGVSALFWKTPIAAGDVASWAEAGVLQDGGSLFNPAVINIWNYLSTAQKADVSSWAGLTDETAAINTAIAALPSTGGVLLFPPGRYISQGNHTISVPVRIMGFGKSPMTQVVPTSGLSQVEFNTDAVNGFNITSPGGVFDIALVDTAGARTNGAAVRVTSTDLLERLDFQSVLTFGFWDAIDIAVGNSWFIRGCDIESSKHFGIRVRNTVNADSGDGTIDGNNILPETGAAAGIKWESSGGLRIVNNKINSNNGLYVDGILFDCAPVTVEWQIIGNNIENCSGVPLNVTQSPVRATIVGNLLNAAAGTNEAIRLTQAAQLIISGNVLTGNNTAISPITFGNVQDLTVGPNIYNGFSSNNLGYLGIGTPARIIDFSATPSTNVFDPANTRGLVTISNGGKTITTSTTTGQLCRTSHASISNTVYAEFTKNAGGNAASMAAGIVNTAQSAFTGYNLGDDANSIGYYGDGGVWIGNVKIATIQTYTTADVPNFCYNPALKKIWFRKNSNGWNNDVIANQNPDTGVGGYNVSGIGSPAYVACSLGFNGCSFTANFGSTGYTNTPPIAAGNS